MKSKEELKQIKEEVVKLGEKLQELNEDELKEVTGGGVPLQIGANANQPMHSEYVGGHLYGVAATPGLVEPKWK